MRLLMVNRSIKNSFGMLYDVLVKVDRFIFPTDFVILDCEIDHEVPIILGRLFLSTGRAFIDVEYGEMKFRVNNDENFKSEVVEEYDEVVTSLTGLGSYTKNPIKLDLDLKNHESPPAKPSIIEPPQLELDLLPSHPQYIFLGEEKTLSIIVAGDLEPCQVDALKSIMKKFIQAIGWTIADIIGIPPEIRSHKIKLNVDHVPSMEHQRRLNQPIQEVVKKEIIKWLDAGVVYPILTSTWVSPIQCVSKKGGMTVFPNENNDLVPMRPVTGWRVCMDYRKLNSWNEKDHFPMPFTDRMLDRIVDRDSIDGHARFYRRFIKDLLKIAHPLCKILENEEKFKFDDDCVKSFNCLKELLVSAPIIVAPNWSLLFELICETGSVALGAFWAYLLGTKVVVHTDHAAVRYFMSKKEAKPQLIRWITLLQEFDFEVKDRKRRENQVADHLSHLESNHEKLGEIDINGTFPKKLVISLSESITHWYADYANYIMSAMVPDELNHYQKKPFLFDVKNYFWDEPFLFRECADSVICRCVMEAEMRDILKACHSSPFGGPHGGI
ncbi:uncharacterized protein LOC124885667 [Capsicum annuum]|uniref:uncharacterized protein LOC124885667 n=1 Tax=Capsicum annuum TaxID=4072 RepID=UPI001FB0ADC6|nr:uncharacterized protein LOC124885667 [Capsicum annuum]